MHSLARLVKFLVISLVLLSIITLGCSSGGIRDDIFATQDQLTTTRTLQGEIALPAAAASVTRDEKTSSDDSTSEIRPAVSGTPVTGAKVWLAGYPSISPVYTDASGTYKFTGLTAGDYMVVSSYIHNNQLYKQTVSATLKTSDTTVNAPALYLQKAVTYLTGVLKNSSGNALPFGTRLELWGESFDIGQNGSFQTPLLPESVTSALISVWLPDATEAKKFYGSFVSGTTPAYVEQMITDANTENNAPSGSLVSKNSSGQVTVTCKPQEQINLTLSSYDPDSADLNRLTYVWQATNGSLSVQSGNKSAVWTAMETKGVATLSVVITDPQNAVAKVYLRMLVDVQSMNEVDVTAPEIKTRTPSPGATSVALDSQIIAGFNEGLLSSAINSTSISASYSGGSIPGSCALQNDKKTIVWTSQSVLPSSQLITVTVSAQIRDLYGNYIAETQPTWTFTTGRVPSVTVATLQTNDSTPLLSGTIDDSTATVVVTVGGTSYNATVSGNTWQAQVTTTLPDGVYEVTARATNKEGFSASDSTVNELTVDTAAKTASLSATPADPTNQTGAEIVVGGTGVTKYKYRLDGGNWSAAIAVSTPINISGLGDGEHTLQVIGGDDLGNWQATGNPTSHVWTVDTTANIAQLSGTPSDPTNQTSVNITVGGDGVTRYKLRLDGGAWSFEYSVAQQLVLSGLTSGDHTLDVIGGDAVGNWQSQNSPTSFSWNVDAVIKVAQLSNTPPNPTNQVNAVITVGGSGVTKYKYQLNTGAWSSEIEVAQPITLSNLGDNTYTLKVVAGDAVGNWQPTTTPTIHVWAVDTGALTVSVNRKTDQITPTNADIVYFTAIFNKPVADFAADDVTLGGAALPAVAEVSPVLPADGKSYTIAVTVMGEGEINASIEAGKATDAAGNVNQASIHVDNTVVRDVTEPKIADVTSDKANGSYPTGTVIDLTLEFDEVVKVTGIPALALNTAPAKSAYYLSGNNSNKLTFRYTVQSGDTSADLDYSGTDALSLNGGTIKDGAGNNAVLSLFAPGDPGSLGANKDIKVDTTTPEVTNVSSPNVNQAYPAGSQIDITLMFSEIVSVDTTFGTPELTLDTLPAKRTAIYVTGGGTDVLTFRYTVQDADNSSDLDYVQVSPLLLNGATIRDAAGNNAKLTLPTPGATGSLSDNKNIVIDGVKALITNVTTTNADGTYPTATAISILVEFNESVRVTGTPQIVLNLPAGRLAYYTGGDGTASLTFVYTVQANDAIGELAYVDASSLQLSGGTIRDLAGNDADTTLPIPGQSGSLDYNRNIAIDAVAPRVQNVSSINDNGTYIIGSVIDVTVTFDKVVRVTGTPRLTLAMDGFDYNVNYHDGDGTNTLTFRYTVNEGDVTADLDYANSNALELNGGTIRDTVGNEAVRLLPNPGAAGSLGANKDIAIDAVAPVIVNISSANDNGTYIVGQSVEISVEFSEEVRVTGTPAPLSAVTLNTTSAGVASYLSGHSTNTLVFRYTVTAGDKTPDGFDLDVALISLNGDTIRDAHGNNANLTLPIPGALHSLSANKDIIIDGILPVITNVYSDDPDGTYIVGDVVDVVVSFDAPVSVTGVPQMALNIGSSNVAAYESGDGTASITFRYTVQAGDSSGDLDYSNTGALTLNGGTIQSVTGNTAVLTLPSPGGAGSLGANNNLIVDGILPTVTNVTSAKVNGSYRTGEIIDITVEFSEAMNLDDTGGTPRLALNTVPTTRYADYQNGSGTNTLTFRYTVQADDNSTDLDYSSTSALTLEGSTLRNAVGNNADLTLAAPGAAGSIGGNKNIAVDTTAPEVSVVSATTLDGTYITGKNIDVTVCFDEIVHVTGIPTFTLALNPGPQIATYLSGDGTATLTFRYTVDVGDWSNDLNYDDINALNLSGGTIRDSAGNDAVLTLPDPAGANSLGGTKNIVIDAVSPRVNDVTSTNANGSYGPGSIINITIEFDERVRVTGTPQLTLNTAPLRTADYAGGDDSDTLTFSYNTQAGDESADLDYLATDSLSLNSGTLRDVAGNNAVLTLVAPGAAGSLGANKDIIVITP